MYQRAGEMPQDPYILSGSDFPKSEFNKLHAFVSLAYDLLYLIKSNAHLSQTESPKIRVRFRFGEHFEQIHIINQCTIFIQI